MQHPTSGPDTFDHGRAAPSSCSVEWGRVGEHHRRKQGLRPQCGPAEEVSNNENEIPQMLSGAGRGTTLSPGGRTIERGPAIAGAGDTTTGSSMEGRRVGKEWDST